ncbi:hypothetical protein [Sphingomonas sp.]|uniref:hypothetical protein n=1 Tax=Sphingomonas sp. TaxID=28214 RepID=UPI00286B2546|nr:hypothetical protein [Sphingomonas sp.]
MRKILFPLAAFSLVLPTSFVGFAAPASAHARNYRHSHYHGQVYRCRRSPGNTGLVAGGVAGGVVGSQVIGHGLVGVAAGAVGGALAGRAIDRSMTARRRGCR